MAETNNGNGEEKPKVDPQKQYLIEQFGNLMEKVGEGYGGPLQEELIRRMEQTIADFDEEVSEVSYEKNSFIYDFMSSMRQKINDPLGVRAKKRKEISQR